MTALRQDANVRAHATTERVARYVALVDRVFWQDRLEVDVGLAARQCATPGFLVGVLAGLTTRCQRVVAEGLTIPVRRLAGDPVSGLPEDACNACATESHTIRTICAHKISNTLNLPRGICPLKIAITKRKDKAVQHRCYRQCRSALLGTGVYHGCIRSDDTRRH